MTILGSISFFIGIFAMWHALATPLNTGARMVRVLAALFLQLAGMGLLWSVQ